jgi:hypothetical protein
MLQDLTLLSIFLPTLEQLKTGFSPANREIPVFFAHGILDSVVAVECGKKYQRSTASDGLPGRMVGFHDGPFRVQGGGRTHRLVYRDDFSLNRYSGAFGFGRNGLGCTW